MELCRLRVPCFLIFLFLLRPISGDTEISLDVAAWLRTLSAPRATLDVEKDKGGRNSWSLQVLHREHLMAETNSTYEDRVRGRLERESGRVEALNRRVEEKLSGDPMRSMKRVDDFGSEVMSGMIEGSGEYFTRIGVGTPAREQYMVLDTGSDVVWVQCEPCNDCYDQADPVFDPSNSASFTSVSCASAVCSELEISDCNSRGCAYQVAYGDGSYSVGSFATETLTFGQTTVQNVGIGCGHDNEGLFVGAGGLLGLGAGRLSFPTQLGTYGKVFSYCLVDRDSESTGFLDFGPEGATGSVYTPFLRNPRLGTFYYVPLTGISVGVLLVTLPQKVFQFDESGRGGVILDSGTAVTRLQTEAYEAMRDAFVAGTNHLPRADGLSIFDTCFDLSGQETVSIPAVSFRFSNGASLGLPARNSLIAVDDLGTFCLAFAPTEGSLSIIGNIQQQGVRVSFDSVNSVVGFAINQC